MQKGPYGKARIVILDLRTSWYLTIESSAVTVWKLLQTGATTDALVAQVCEEFDLTERALQRLVRRRIGITPKWLIQRRRLHEAAERLRVGAGNLAAVAADLGYADQPHFTRDFQTVTGMTPGAFAARFSAD